MAFVALGLAACGGDDAPAGMDGGRFVRDGHADVPRVDAGPPPPPSANWCERIQPGAPGEHDVAVDLSAAHGGVRFFGAERAYSAVDQALAGALGNAAALEPDVLPVTLATYAAALDATCARAAETGSLGAARVERADPAVIVRPGTGSVSIPADARVVAIDLRELPATDGLAAALESAVAPALASPVPRSGRRVRTHYGMTDEVVTSDNVYSNARFVLEQPPIPARGDSDRVLVLLTGPSLPPAAAELAGTLRLAGRAWIVGEDVLAAVAEARWQGVGSQGVAWRTADLMLGDQRWPDVIAADYPASQTNELLATLDAPPPEAPLGEVTRSEIVATSPFGDVQPASFSLGHARAAMLGAHAAARLFHPYSQGSGPLLDARLAEVLDWLDGSFEPDAETVYQLLRRFSNALADGQSIVIDEPNTRGIVGVVPLVLEKVRESYVVRRSGVPEVLPGETLASIDGAATADRIAVELDRTSAATDGHRLELAMRQALSARGETMLGVLGADGTTRDVLATPVSREEYATLLGDAGRTNGTLDDLEAPDLYYLNLDASAVPDAETFRAALTEAEGSAGLVLDLRGSPGFDTTEVAARLVDRPQPSLRFRVPTFVGMDERDSDERSSTIVPADAPSFLGPVALLVGPRTTGFAESLATLLVSARRVTLVGRQTSGTVTGICGVQLPGSFALTFGCTETRLPNGDPFHGVGLRPDVTVRPTTAQLAAGIDPELTTAVTEL